MLLDHIYVGDCLDVLRTLPDNSIDLVVTSPPYNKKGLRGGKDTGGKRWAKTGGNINYDEFDDNMPEDEYIQWQTDVLDECYRILKPSGSLFYNHKVRRYKGRGYHPYEIIRGSNMHFYQHITWDRKGTWDGNVGYCSPTTEMIFWMVKDKPKVRKKQAEHKTEIWTIVPKPDKNHPAPFPEAVLHTEDNTEEVAKWCGGIVQYEQDRPQPMFLIIPTLEGDHRSYPGEDYIIKDLAGSSTHAR